MGPCLQTLLQQLEAFCLRYLHFFCVKNKPLKIQVSLDSLGKAPTHPRVAQLKWWQTAQEWVQDSFAPTWALHDSVFPPKGGKFTILRVL